ncbi:zf-TFIIB domain-containing protein [Sphingomonas bacterium]|uniref:TFIIB-type zinc ribbon-containing protein n=1 Tax=Sphingomonas bacterium TaxID=1895847 RepID=UPI00261818E3|nr:zf-TFIIB domain-containing protein [Sphingomonas bacterium]MDB5679442.1 hypothetical protein [Sphingomonas bacterium]
MSNFTCPVDGATLVPMERQGIEIDHCPTCRGIWLDRGELDKIIERSAAPAPPSREMAYEERRPSYGDRPSLDDRHRPKRKRSFLEDLFD